MDEAQEDRDKRLLAIKARLSSVSHTRRRDLYGSVERLVVEDLPWLISEMEKQRALSLESP